MKPLRALLLLALFIPLASCASQRDPLPSWNDTATKSRIINFVDDVTSPASPDFIPPVERIAVFDNDGTLWGEQPMYVQVAFAIDRVKALAPQHPEWKTQEPFASVLRNDIKGVAASGEKGLMQIFGATHAGMTVDQFDETVQQWITTARHPTTGLLYTQMAYQPMVELLDYLRDEGFDTFIVSGGGIEFMRPWTERVYGIPPQNVVGSSLKMKYEIPAGIPEIVKLPEVDLIDDKEGKPVGIASHIGMRPVMAFGNSDGDLQMLQYTTIPRSPNDNSARFGAFVHHTDAQREYAYDRESHIGRLDKGLDEAPKRGWLLIDMRRDWNTIYVGAPTR